MAVSGLIDEIIDADHEFLGTLEAHEVDPSKKAGWLTNLLCGIVTVAFGIVSMFEAVRLGVGDIKDPDTGTWPSVVSAVIIVVGILIVIRAKSFDDAETLGKDSLPVIVGTVSLSIAVGLIPFVGFELPSVALLVFWMSYLGDEKYKLSIPLSIGAVAVFYAIFVIGLRVPLPHLF